MGSDHNGFAANDGRGNCDYTAEAPDSSIDTNVRCKVTRSVKEMLCKRVKTYNYLPLTDEQKQKEQGLIEHKRSIYVGESQEKTAP